MALALRKRPRSISTKSNGSSKREKKITKTTMLSKNEVVETSVRCSLRLKNKIENNKGDCNDNLNSNKLKRKASEESVIYVKTTKMEIPIIDLTASSTSLESVDCLSDFRLKKRRRRHYKKRKIVRKSTSLLTLGKSRSSISSFSSVSSKNSVGNKRSGHTVVWKLKKSYNLSLRLQNRLRSKSKQNSSTSLKNDELPNDLKDVLVQVTPILQGELKDKSVDELVKIYKN